MNTSELFHAYIVGGTRDDARRHIELLLSPHNVLNPGNPDFVVSEYVNFSIDDARALTEWQSLSAVGKRKVHVLYTDFITREAENALLKTLEEPVKNTHIIFAVPNPAVLLETLLSRVRVIIPETTESNTKEAQAFLQATVGERLSIISKMLEKSDTDDASAEVRERALSFLNDLERELSKDTVVNTKKLEQILQLKPYLYIPGSSIRTILETVALTF